jgi:hypothetical protein
MRDFLWNTLRFSLLSIFAFAILAYPFAPNEQANDYLASIIDKHACMKKTSSPRLVFAGDSNLAFGLDTQTVKQALGRPACNLGLHGGFGLNFVLAEAEHLARPGDTVVLAVNWNAGAGDPAVKAAVQSYSPSTYRFAYRDGMYDAVKTLSGFVHFNILRNLNTLIYRVSGLNQQPVELSSLYRRSSFTPDGDINFSLRGDFKHTFKTLSVINWEENGSIRTINDYNKKMQSRGIRLLVTFPPYPLSLYKKDAQKFKVYESNLRARLEAPLLGEADSFIFDDTLFYDTEYHLNPEGRAVRTSKIVELLKEKLEIHLTRSASH